MLASPFTPRRLTCGELRDAREVDLFSEWLEAGKDYSKTVV
jgi:hypothetical protein